MRASEAALAAPKNDTVAKVMSLAISRNTVRIRTSVPSISAMVAAPVGASQDRYLIELANRHRPASARPTPGLNGHAALLGF
jgi:hypothetical protein